MICYVDSVLVFGTLETGDISMVRSELFDAATLHSCCLRGIAIANTSVKLSWRV